MIAILILLRSLLGSLFKSRARITAENILLRHQLNIARRRGPKRARLSNWDRWGLVWVYRIVPDALNAVSLVRPETVIRWHRQGFRAFWRWKSRPRGGRPRIPQELRDLVREMSRAKSPLGCAADPWRVAQARLEVAESTVAKYMVRSGRGRSQTWKTFLHNHAAGRAAMDFLIVPTVGFKLLFVLVILRHQRRRLISLSVTANPTAAWVWHQLIEATPWSHKPHHLLRDRDAVYGRDFRQRAQRVGIDAIATPIHAPKANAVAERVIGTLRRECLDHIIIVDENHLRSVLAEYVGYYNRDRPHRTLGLQTPEPRLRPVTGPIHSRPALNGLHHIYERAA